MSVLFSDIRGFTAASENASPEDVVAQLNEYFSVMVRVLHAHGGTLDKFVGDMVMGLFGAPVADPQHAAHAVTAAMEMVRELARLNAKWAGEGRAPFRIGLDRGDQLDALLGLERVGMAVRHVAGSDDEDADHQRSPFSPGLCSFGPFSVIGSGALSVGRFGAFSTPFQGFAGL